jgi:hypothetical protein
MHTTELGIIKRFSIIDSATAIVTICGGGAQGDRMINLSKAIKQFK